MKKKLLKSCICFSTILFLGFVCLYAYVWIAEPNPKEINSSNGPDWRSISIGHGKITIAHSLLPSNDTNRPGLLTYPEDGGGNFHITVEKCDMEDMHGCYLIFLNQNIPYQLNFSFPFADRDKMIVKNSFRGYGMEFGSGTHSTKMLGCADNDRTSLMEFIGYGIFFTDISHSVDKDKTWWTLMISLWYLIILFGILPAIFVIKKLRNRKPAFPHGTAIETKDEI